MIDFHLLKFNFPAITGHPQHQTMHAIFVSRVHRAFAAIKGFDIGYNDGDHHLYRFQLDTSTIIRGNTVDVTVTYGLRDSSGTFDDPYNALVDVLVIVEREGQIPPILFGEAPPA